MGDFTRVLSVSELPQGQMKSCQIAGREVVVCNTRDGVFAVDNICTHAFARMSEGRLKGVRLICPMHGAAFDVRNGAVLGGPATQSLQTHTVRVVDGALEVAVDASL